MAQGSGEKTEKASPKKRRDVRKKGEVHKSADLCSAVMLFLMFGTLKVGCEAFMRTMRGITASLLSGRFVAESAESLTAGSAMRYFGDVLHAVAPVMVPVLGVAAVGGALVHVVQTGPMFVTEKLKPDFKRISPISGFRRIFSTASLVELGKAVLKTAILCYIAYAYLKSAIREFVGYIRADVGMAFLRALSESFSMGMMIGIALIAFAALDVLYQWWRFEKEIMMTKQEVKEELKQLEGDPQVKSRIRQRQRKMSAQRMMRRLKEATVVVTNPEHYAVALRYRENEDRAPVVVAKGQDYLAQRIKEKAREYRVAVVENKPVARALYVSCEIGEEIPPELYQAVADILIYVYRTIGSYRRGER